MSSLAVMLLLSSSSHTAALPSFIRPLPLRPSSVMTSTYLAKLPVSRALMHFFLHLSFIVPIIQDLARNIFTFQPRRCELANHIFPRFSDQTSVLGGTGGCCSLCSCTGCGWLELGLGTGISGVMECRNGTCSGGTGGLGALRRVVRFGEVSVRQKQVCRD
jgi:hypothetical protein